MRWFQFAILIIVQFSLVISAIALGAPVNERLLFGRLIWTPYLDASNLGEQFGRKQFGRAIWATSYFGAIALFPYCPIQHAGDLLGEGSISLLGLGAGRAKPAPTATLPASADSLN
ncbi:MAG: hypothetical protein F6J93_29355 [Oscillatoria sp. SIO1A7]|nr:hypothetical protein [Oscillatoria sp. SIO1A7]